MKALLPFAVAIGLSGAAATAQQINQPVIPVGSEAYCFAELQWPDGKTYLSVVHLAQRDAETTGIEAGKKYQSEHPSLKGASAKILWDYSRNEVILFNVHENTFGDEPGDTFSNGYGDKNPKYGGKSNGKNDSISYLGDVEKKNVESILATPACLGK